MRKCKCGKPAKWLKHNRKFMCDDCAVEAGLLMPCPGAAHSIPYIDYCCVCMPRWGLVEVVYVNPLHPNADAASNFDGISHIVAKQTGNEP